MSSPLKRAASEDITKQEDWDGVLDFEELIDEQETKTQADSEEEPSNSATTDENSTSSTGQPSGKAKKQRRGKNSPEPNYSAMVQEQMSSTNRTGQACDRCKVSCLLSGYPQLAEISSTSLCLPSITVSLSTALFGNAPLPWLSASSHVL